MAAEDWKYRPALDGLRALAVVAVVLFHTWPETFPGGFVGVDLFFVLSGYLITGLLLSERELTGGVDLRSFWFRRVRRLMPAVLVLVPVVSVVTAMLGTTSARSLANAWGALTWSTNWVELGFADRTWWASDMRTVLDHLWSLAVEEQFYVVWPLVISFGVARLGRRGRLGVLAALVGVSALISGWVGYPDAYFRTDARALELVAGALLAVAGRKPGERAAGALVTGGLIGLGVVVAWGDPTESWMYPWGVLGIAAVASALVAGCLEPNGMVAMAFTARPVRAVGRVSYGIYLWHIPVIRILNTERVGLASPWLHLVRLVVLGVLVGASYRWIEQPLRHGRVGRWVLVGLAVVAAASTVLMIPGARRAVEAQWEVADDRPAPAAGPGDIRVLVVGDLLGGIVGAGLAQADLPPGGPDLAVWNTADLGCAFSRPGTPVGLNGPLEVVEFCRRWPERWRAAIGEFDPDVIVWSVGLWDSLPWQVGGRRLDVEADRQRLALTTQRQLDELRRSLSSDRSVVVITVDDIAAISPPEQQDDDARRERLRALSSGVTAWERGLSGPEADRVRRVTVAAPDAEELERFGATGLAQTVVASAKP